VGLQARLWGLNDEAEDIEESLSRYINNENALDIFFAARKNKQTILMKKAAGVYNTFDLGMKIEVLEDLSLKVKFLDLKMLSTLPDYKVFSSLATELAFPFSLSEEKSYHDVIKMTPKLRALDFSDSEGPPFEWERWPATLQKLKLSRCHWLDDQLFEEIFSHFPTLKSLELQENPQLTLESWGLLAGKGIEELDLSEHRQLTDEDIKVIAQSAKYLKYLSLKGAKHLTSAGLTPLLNSASSLKYLNVSKTGFEDRNLGSLARTLEELDLSFTSVSEAPLRKTLIALPQLKKLDVSNTRIDPSIKFDLDRLR
jgi:hypothetical protein